MISKERYELITSQSTGMALDAIWVHICQDAESYAERKILFIWMLKKMLQEDMILLAKKGHVINWQLDDAISRFEGAFPADDESLNNGVWFFTDGCPAGIGWKMPDGFIDWV